MSNFGNAPAGRNVDSITFFAHISGGVAGTTATNLIEGAVAINPLDASIDNNQCILASAAANKGVLGVVTDAYGSGGPVEGRPVTVRYLGLVGINIAASTTIAFGDKLITANSSGDAKAWTNETGVDVIGVAMEALTSQAARGRILCRLQIQYLP